jgi:hypothetical protein
MGAAFARALAASRWSRCTVSVAQKVDVDDTMRVGVAEAVYSNCTTICSE